MTQLEFLREQLLACTERARALPRNPDWSRSPAPGVWSPAECVAHLTQSTGVMLPPLEEAARRAGPASTPYQHTWSERLFLWYIEPPYRLKVKTRGGFVPEPAPPGDVLPAFEARQQRLDQFLQSVAGKALDKVKIHSPFNARFTYSAWTGLVLILAHQRRHLWQAEQILARLRV